jgi:hypothetical protein
MNETENKEDTDIRKEAYKQSPKNESLEKAMKKLGYINYSDLKSEEGDRMEIDIPYVITPEAFMEHEDYDHVTLTYYADGVLADENDEIIDNVDDVVGLESLKHFGEYEDDSVYVRNDGRKIDYEILLDNREYSEINLPSSTED